MGESGEKNNGEERMWGKGRRVAKSRLYRAGSGLAGRRERGEDCLSPASSAAPDGGAACDRLGPITAAALLGSFFSLLRRMNEYDTHDSWIPHRVRNDPVLESPGMSPRT